jgi:vacuolar iron transporter family protein
MYTYSQERDALWQLSPMKKSSSTVQEAQCRSFCEYYQRAPSREIGMAHRERHRSERIGWLRAAVLGADDGIVSTASLVVGVAVAGSSRHEILLAGIAGLVAGAFSMAAGEYVSVSSQADTERADLATEKMELKTQWSAEVKELAAIYVRRGVDPELARTVAEQLMARDALGAHARDELGITEQMTARPLQAAGASAGTFAAGAALPLLVVLIAPLSILAIAVSAASLACLAGLGALAARTGGASPWAGARRVAFWGALAMAATAGVGRLFGTSVS